LLPKDAGARARAATQWLIAALNSIEPHLMNVALANIDTNPVQNRSVLVDADAILSITAQTRERQTSLH